MTVQKSPQGILSVIKGGILKKKRKKDGDFLHRWTGENLNGFKLKGRRFRRDGRRKFPGRGEALA